MGCKLSGFDNRSASSNLNNNNDLNAVEYITSSLQLIHYFPEMDKVPKCIFMFGTSGSNKGEFIYEMITSSWNNYRIEQTFLEHQENLKKNISQQPTLETSNIKNVNNNLKVKNKSRKQSSDSSNSENNIQSKFKFNYGNNVEIFLKSVQQKQFMQNKNTKSSFVNSSSPDFREGLSNFVYSHIDLEKLIIDNLNDRIKELNNVEMFELKNLESQLNFNNLIKKIQKEDNIFNSQNQNLDNKEDLLNENQANPHKPSEDKSNVENNLKKNLIQNKSKSVSKDLNDNLNQEPNENKNNVKTLDNFEYKYWMRILDVCKEDFENNNVRTVKYKFQTLKEYLKAYSNCVTNNWILNLIEKEINTSLKNRYERFKSRLQVLNENSCVQLEESLNLDEEQQRNDKKNANDMKFKKKIKLIKQLNKIPETIYIITIVPNQINLFRDCLFLKQNLNLANFKLNYIAINLISGDSVMRDIDSNMICHSLYDEINLNYLNYFRNRKKLINIQYKKFNKTFKLKITKNKQAFKINNEQDINKLLDILEDNLQIDLNNFQIKNPKSKIENASSIKKEKSLLFLIDNKIDLDDLVLVLEDKTLDKSKLKSFVQTYHEQKKIKYNIDFIY